MKSLVAFHSRTGNTRTVAQEIARSLGSDLEEITVKGKRDGPLGYLKCGYEWSRRIPAPINAPSKDPSAYDILIVGGPIWSFTLSSPIRAYLSKYGLKAKKIAFFCTFGGAGSAKAFSEMSLLCGNAAATLAIKEKELEDGSYKEKIKWFVQSIS